MPEMTDTELSEAVAREVFNEDPCMCPRTEIAPSLARHPRGPFDTKSGKHYACGKLPCSIRVPLDPRDAERVWDWLVQQGVDNTVVRVDRGPDDTGVVIFDGPSMTRGGWSKHAPDWKRALCLAALEVARR